MDQNPTKTTGIVLHRGRLYDLFFGPFVRLSDTAVLDLAEVSAGDRVLDIGTGPGYLALAASRRVGPKGLAVGIDASPEMIERARERAMRRRSSAEYRVAAAESLPFDDGTFDVVVNRLVFHHLVGDLKELALGEIGRVLKPGGRLLIADMSSRAARGGHHLAAHILGTHSEAERHLEELVADAGFIKVRSSRLMHGLLEAVFARNPERNLA